MVPHSVFFLILSTLAIVSTVVAEKERVEDGAMSGRLRSHRDDHRVDLDALVGSRKEADALGNLPAVESKRRLVAVAKKMDTDKDGKVSKEELVEWIVKAIRSVDEEEAEERMREVDEDGDGFVTWKEHVQDAFPHDKPEELDREDRKLLDEDEKYFRAADVNGDGKLDREEFAAFLTPENFPHMHSVLVELTKAEKDEDGDGAINLKEFLGEMYDQSHSEWNKVETERFSREYDKDGDGKLTGEEVVRWLIPEVRDTAVAEAEHLIERADENKDGSLSYEEIGEQYELFVSSEATHYGDHLDDIKHEEL